MKQYVCSICGYVYDEAVSGPWEALPADWKCPICKAGKEAFRVLEEAPQPQAQLEKPHVETELSPMEMSIICSNLARGCEKQYLFEEMDGFQKLAEFFRRNGGEKTFSSVLFEGYRRGKRAARGVAGDVAEAGFVYRLRKRKGAAVHYRDFSALQENFNGIEFHTRYCCEHMFPGPHSDAVRKREAGKTLVLFDYRLNNVGELAGFVCKPDAGALRGHQAHRRLFA